jgi:hypothetical protein
MKHVGTLLVLLLWSQSSWAGPIELRQLVEFKWRGLSVATMNFAVSIPAEDAPSALNDANEAPSEPSVLIELVGQTKGPLRWLQDYQATVRYVQMDSQGLVNAFTLVGTDNGEPERRHIVFDANRLPEIELFDDSTATQALAPQADWLGNTINPLVVFKKMLLAAAGQESCEADFWGYDGKRRYRLTLRDISLRKGATPSYGPTVPLPEVTNYVYACELTMYAKGRQSAGGQRVKPSLMASKFAALWPFGDRDLRMTFVIKVLPIKKSDSLLRLEIADVRIHTRIGAVVGNGLPDE